MEIRGANAPPIIIKRPQKYAFSRPGCGQVATAGGYTSLFCVLTLSSAGFLVSASGFDETAFDLWL